MARGAMVGAMNATLTPTLIEIPAGNRTLRGILYLPANARAIIVFVHGHDSSSLSPRNRVVARSLLDRGFAILQPDLIELAAESPAPGVLDERDELRAAANRLIVMIDWLAANPATSGLRIGLFGARSGAGAAMIAAALRPSKVHAVVSRGGMLDLASDLLSEVQAPTLMLVGSRDQSVIDHNRQAGAKMRCKPMLELIQGASHLFAEPGKLEQVASMSFLWFRQTLAKCS